MTHVPTAHIHLLFCCGGGIILEEIGAYGTLWTFKEGVEKRDIRRAKRTGNILRKAADVHTKSLLECVPEKSGDWNTNLKGTNGR